MCHYSIEELASVATSFRGEIAPAPAGQLAYVSRVPYGVVFAMAPWNAPMILGLRAVACPIVRTIKSRKTTVLLRATMFADGW